MKTSLFNCGFRPFFLAASLYVSFVVPLWIFLYSGSLQFEPFTSQVLWHAHEMLYGFTLAVIAGFLLTAVPNWTKTGPVKGTRLAALVCVWLAGRVAMFIPNITLLAAMIDLAFIPFLAGALAFPLLKKFKLKNFIFVILLSFLFICNLFIHLSNDLAYIALYFAIFIILQMIVLIGGRVIPLFTFNALRLEGVHVNIKTPFIINILALISIPVLIVSIFIVGIEHVLTGYIALVSGIIHFIRLTTWQWQKILHNPLLWILHAGYLWIPLGLFMLFAFVQNVLPLQIVLHTFTMGAIGTMTLGMMSRVSLGHTGRVLSLSKYIIPAYFLVICATIIRILGGINSYFYDVSVIISGGMWALGFFIFAIVYAKVLTTPRPDGGST